MKLLSTVGFFISAPFVHTGFGAEDGLAKTPPMGWRSWNYFGGNVSDTKIRRTVDAFVDRSRVVDGVKTSLLDLGYNDIGLDDNWQACGQGSKMGSYHDVNGAPLVNRKTFPSMKSMVKYGHDRGVKMGWYFNNCICPETIFNFNVKAVKGNAKAIRDAGFDSVKLDNCGPYHDLGQWYDELNNAGAGKPIEIENCHWGQTVPKHDWCPFHFFRTSNDINQHWDSVWSNLQTTRPFQDKYDPLAKQGCWAYPDMLEVGMLASFQEDRSHFGAWCIVSSPLILGHNPFDKALIDRIWPIISNKEAIAVNQAWYGHPGRLVDQVYSGEDVIAQLWNKPIGKGKTAVFVIGNMKTDVSTDVTVDLADLDNIDESSNYHVRDIWNQGDVAVSVKGSFPVTVSGHDSVFLILSKY